MKARVWYLIPLAVLAIGAAGCGGPDPNAPPPAGYDASKPGSIPAGASGQGGSGRTNGPMGGGPMGGNAPMGAPR